MPTLPRRAARQGTMCYVYIGALMPLFVVGMLVGYTRDGGQPAAPATAPVVGAAGLARSSGGVDTTRAVFSAAALHTEGGAAWAAARIAVLRIVRIGFSFLVKI